MAELVRSTLQTQCLNRRIPDAATLRSEVAAWEIERNEMNVTIDWQFTHEDARTKLYRLYPTLVPTSIRRFSFERVSFIRGVTTPRILRQIGVDGLAGDGVRFELVEHTREQ